MKFDIVGKFRLWFFISAVMLGIGIAALAYNSFSRGKAMNFGIDFTGGTVITLRFDQKAEIGRNIGEVRSILSGFELRESVIQLVGENDLTIRSEPVDSQARAGIISELQSRFGSVELLEADTIGPVIGRELRKQAFWALLLATIGILLYVSFRFEFKYAVAAIAALWHDAIITVGIVALLWRSVDTAFVAALLTIIGYSINDTIVIFDRIRENKLKSRDQEDFGELINASVMQTLARSINTVITVLFINVALLIFGGATLKDFAATLLIGFSLGAYSSIFIAPPLLYLTEKRFGKKKKRRA
jgi:preprotein translocase subunit SecF